MTNLSLGCIKRYFRLVQMHEGPGALRLAGPDIFACSEKSGKLQKGFTESVALGLRV